MTARRIIVLEPEDKTASAIEHFLIDRNFDVARVRDPAQLKWMAPIIKPNVVLVDFQPKDSVEIAKNLRSNGLDSEVALVIVVKDGFEEKNPKITKQLKELYDGFLYKPFEDADLLRVIENFTGFGDTSEEEVGVALDNLLDMGTNNPELKKVLDNLKETHGKNNKGKPGEADGKEKADGNKIASLEERLKEVEAELSFAKNQNKHQSEKIADLLGRLNEKIDQDQTGRIDKLQEEKRELEKEVGMLYGRIEEIENLLEDLKTLFAERQKKISDVLDKP